MDAFLKAPAHYKRLAELLEAPGRLLVLDTSALLTEMGLEDLKATEEHRERAPYLRLLAEETATLLRETPELVVSGSVRLETDNALRKKDNALKGAAHAEFAAVVAAAEEAHARSRERFAPDQEAVKEVSRILLRLTEPKSYDSKPVSRTDTGVAAQGHYLRGKGHEVAIATSDCDIDWACAAFRKNRVWLAGRHAAAFGYWGAHNDVIPVYRPAWVAHAPSRARYP